MRKVLLLASALIFAGACSVSAAPLASVSKTVPALTGGDLMLLAHKRVVKRRVVRPRMTRPRRLERQLGAARPMTTQRALRRRQN